MDYVLPDGFGKSGLVPYFTDVINPSGLPSISIPGPVPTGSVGTGVGSWIQWGIGQVLNAIQGGQSGAPAGMTSSQLPIPSPTGGIGPIVGPLMQGAPSCPAPASGTCRGYHLNKTSYFLKTTGQFVPAGTKWVRNRRMNPLNPRALRRAFRREDGFERFVRRAAKSSRFKVTRR